MEARHVLTLAEEACLNEEKMMPEHVLKLCLSQENMRSVKTVEEVLRILDKFLDT